jgi:hypothetical protein
MTTERNVHHVVTAAPIADRVRPAGWRWVWLLARVAGAFALLAAGAVHLHEYHGFYSAVPTIGPLSLVNFVGATAIGVALLAPLEHLTGRFRGAAVGLFTTGGIGLAAGSFVMLLVSEHSSIFGFHEAGYDPAAISAARASELATVALLVTSLVIRFATRGPKARW